MQGITWRQHGARHVGLRLDPGVVGDNGAGKSPLLTVLSGLYPASQGNLVLDGETVHLH